MPVLKLPQNAKAAVKSKDGRAKLFFDNLTTSFISDYFPRAKPMQRYEEGYIVNDAGQSIVGYRDPIEGRFIPL